MKKILDQTGKILRKHGKELYKPMTLDALFLFLFGFVVSGFFQKLIELMFAAGNITIQQSAAAQSTESVWEFVKQDPVLQQLTWKIILVLVLLALAIYGIYCIIQGAVWGLLGSWVKKTSMKTYMKRFFLVNILFGILFCIFVVVSYFARLQTNISKNLVPGVLPPDYSTPLIITAIVLLYLSSLSYILIIKQKPLQALKNTFKLTFTKFPDLVLPIAAIVVLCVLVNFIIIALKPLATAGIVIGLLLALATVTVSRLIAIEAVTKL